MGRVIVKHHVSIPRGKKSSGLGGKVILYTDHCKVIEILISLPIRMHAHCFSENSRYLVFDRSKKCMTIHQENNFLWLCLFWLLSPWDCCVYPGTELRNSVFSYTALSVMWSVMILCSAALAHSLGDLSWVGYTLILTSSRTFWRAVHLSCHTHSRDWHGGHVKGTGWALTSQQPHLLQRRRPPGLFLPWAWWEKDREWAKTDGAEKGKGNKSGKDATRGGRDFVS